MTLSPEEYEDLFGNIGTDVVNANKHSVVMKKTFSNDEINQLFGKLIDGIKVQTYSVPRNFRKQFKEGTSMLP